MKGDEKNSCIEKRILRSRSPPAGSEVLHSGGKSQVSSDFKSFLSDNWMNKTFRKADRAVVKTIVN